MGIKRTGLLLTKLLLVSLATIGLVNTKIRIKLSEEWSWGELNWYQKLLIPLWPALYVLLLVYYLMYALGYTAMRSVRRR